MMFFSSTSISTLLHVLAACLPFVAAQFTTDQFNTKISSTAAPPGYNVEGGSVFNNFVNALNDGQLFLLNTGSSVFEKPQGAPVQISFLDWCSDLTFSDFSNSSTVGGYAGRCVSMILAGYAEALAAGAQVPFDYSEGVFTATLGISAVFAEQSNIFEGQWHNNADDVVVRYWDDGSKTSPTIGWEGHDEGDMSPNAATSSFSYIGDITWMSVEEVAQLFNTSTDEFTPEKFKQVYKDTWIKTHEKEAAENNPNPEPELAIIEEVMNETDSAGETTVPAAPGTAEDGGTTDASDPTEVDDSGTGRKLTSATARFVSAALRVFGI